MIKRRRRRELAGLIASTRCGDTVAMDGAISAIVRNQRVVDALYWSIHQLTEANALMLRNMVGSMDSGAVTLVLFGTMPIDTLPPTDRAAGRILLAGFAGSWPDIDRQLDIVATNAGPDGWIDVLSETVDWTSTLIDCCTSAGHELPRWLTGIPSATGYR